MTFPWQYLYISVVAFMVGGLIVFSERWHGRYTGDYDLNKPQASHKKSTPRIGGLAVFAGTLAGLLVLGRPDNMTLNWLWPALFVASMPVFVAGILEDITKTLARASACWLLSCLPPLPGGFLVGSAASALMFSITFWASGRFH